MAEQVKLKAGEYIATCRDCGARGIEDATDLAPGLCPSCFDKRMAAAMVRCESAITLHEHYAILRNAGLTDHAAKVFIIGGIFVTPGLWIDVHNGRPMLGNTDA